MVKDLRPILDEIKDRADIVEIIGGVIPLKRQGKDWFGVCPFHADKDPSFSVVPAKKMFHCFGCKASGDVFEFWSKFHNVSFMEAAREVARQCGMELQGSRRQADDYARYPRVKETAAWKPEAKDRPRELWREKALKFVYWANEEMFKVPEIMAWLKARGIDEGIGRYGLGWNPVDRYRSREAWGLFSLIGKKGRKRPLWLPAGLVIPVFINGDVGRIRIRRPDPIEFGPRYYIVPGSATHTMVLEPERSAYVIVESELDAVLIAQEASELAGAMALGSVSARPDKQAVEILQKALHIMVALDFDGAGAKAWSWWQRHFPDSVRWPVSKGKDPGEAFQAGVDIREWIRAGLPPGLR